jgi:hypothetical protein
MAFDSLTDLSPEHAYAHRIAAKALAKYCQEFARWRAAERVSTGLPQSKRPQGMLVTPLTEKPDPPVPNSAA